MRWFAFAALLVLAGCADPGDGSDAGTPTTSPTASPPPTASPSPSPTDGPAERFPPFEDFEAGGLGAWQPDADVPADPNRPGQEVSWNVTVRNGTGYEDHVHVLPHPVHAARFCIDGRQDDGTVWIERTFPLDAARGHRVNASFWAWSQGESFNTIAHAVLYVGPYDPEREQDFPAPGAQGAHGKGGGLRQPLDRRDGWDQYAAAFDLPPGQGTVWVALGISVVWETEACYFLDALRVVAEPR